MNFMDNFAAIQNREVSDFSQEPKECKTARNTEVQDIIFPFTEENPLNNSLVHLEFQKVGDRPVHRRHTSKTTDLIGETSLNSPSVRDHISSPDKSIEVELIEDVSEYQRFNQSTVISYKQPNKERQNESDREFFKLTLLSHQLNHKKFRVIQSINADELYKQARFQLNLGFNKYSEFIKTELEKYYLLKTKNADPNRFLGREKDLKYYNGAKIYMDAKKLSESCIDSPLRIQILDE